MSVISRQFAKDILLSTIFVLIVLIALFAFFDLIGQLDDLGADYTIGRAFRVNAKGYPIATVNKASLMPLVHEEI